MSPPPSGTPATSPASTPPRRPSSGRSTHLSPEELAAPSLLPGWTRAHVVAHVALNGFALAGVLDGLVHDQPVAMYESDEQRDAQIEDLAEAEPSELREQHLAATTAFADAVEALQDEHWSGHIDRLPGGPAWPAVAVVPTRRREVEVHHADLGTSYTRADWPRDFVAELLDTVVVDHFFFFIFIWARRARRAPRPGPRRSGSPGGCAVPRRPTASLTAGPARGSRGRRRGGSAAAPGSP